MFTKEELDGLEFYHHENLILYRLELDYDGETFKICFEVKIINNYKQDAILECFNSGVWIPTKESLLKLKFKLL